MILSRIELRDWRSYSSLNLTFDKGLNIIEGKNGEGKTNIAEAIHYLSFAHSWRVDDDTRLLRFGASNSLIRAYVSEGELKRLIEIRLSKDGKRILLNEKPLRKLSELSSLTNVLLFSPIDTGLFVGSPGNRRSFLDTSIAKTDSAYLSLIGTYRHLLAERNASLKAEKRNLDYLEVLVERLLEVEKPIIEKRLAYVNSLNEHLSPLASRLFGSHRAVKVVYRPFLEMNDNFIEEGKKAYKKSLESDLIHKSTSLGVHREDFVCYLDGKDIGVYGSQGENRLAAIALKLCPYFLISQPNKKPIAVLDDIYSELDSFHAKNLSTLLLTLNQTFVTATKLNIPGASYIEVTDHKAYRRKSEYGE